MSEHPTHSAHHHASKLTHRERTMALTIVALAFVMDLLDNTIVNIAIPSIRENLHASYATIQWLIAGYALSFAVLLITGGRMDLTVNKDPSIHLCRTCRVAFLATHTNRWYLLNSRARTNNG